MIAVSLGDGIARDGRVYHGQGEPGGVSGLVPVRRDEGDRAGRCKDRRRLVVSQTGDGDPELPDVGYKLVATYLGPVI